MNRDKVAALRYFIDHLRTMQEDEQPQSATLVYDMSTRAQKMRREADRLEERDRMLALARLAIAELKVTDE